MPISAASVTSGSDGTTGTTATTASITPGSNKLQLLHVMGHPALGPVNCTVGGCGLNWVELQNHNWDTGNGQTQQVFRAMGSSPTTGSLTMTYSANQLEISWSLIEFDGVDTSGTDGSGAVVQSVKASGTSATALATLAAFSSTDNATYGAMVCGSGGGSLTEGSGFTAIHDFQGPTTAEFMLSEFKTANDTSVDATLTSDPWGAIAVEIAIAPGPVPRIITPITSVSM